MKPILIFLVASLSFARTGHAESYTGLILCPMVGSFSSPHSIAWKNFKVSIKGSLDPKTWQTIVSSDVSEADYEVTQFITEVQESNLGSFVALIKFTSIDKKSNGVPETPASVDDLFVADRNFYLRAAWQIKSKDGEIPSGYQLIHFLADRGARGGRYLFRASQDQQTYEGECEFSGDLWGALPKTVTGGQ